MKKYIEQLNDRPPHHKRRIAMQLSACATLAVVAVWLTSLPVRLENTEGAATAQSDTSGLVAGAAAAGAQIQNQFTQLQAGSPVQGGYQNRAPSQATTSAPAVLLDTGATVGTPVDQSSVTNYNDTNQ